MKLNSKIDRFIDKADSSLKAIASVDVDGLFAVHDLKVIQGKDRKFVQMPSNSYEDRDGNMQYRPYFHATTKLSHEMLQQSVLAAYDSAVEMRQRSEVEITEDEQSDEDMDEESEADFSMQ